MPDRNRWTVAMGLPSALVGTPCQRDRNRSAGLRVTVPFPEVARAEVLEDERHDGDGVRLQDVVAGARHERERRGRQPLGEEFRFLGGNDRIVLSPEEEDRDLSFLEASL